MSAFWGLLKKDYSLARTGYLVWLAFLLFGMAASFWGAQWASEPSIVVPFFVTMAGMHMFLAPITLLTLLNREGKTQLWLYNPQGSYKLLLSKLAVVASLQLFAQILISVYSLFVMKWLVNHGLIDRFSQFLPFKQGLYMQIGLFAASIYICIWITFLWTIYHSLGKYPALKNLRWLVIIVVYYVYQMGEWLLSKTKLFQNKAFEFSVNVEIAPKMNYTGADNGWRIIYGDAAVPIVFIILYLIISIIIFLLACRLLDRKVEV